MRARESSIQDHFSAEPRSFDLRDYSRVLQRRWVSVVTLTLIGLLGGMAYAVHSKPHFAATAQVVVTPLTEGPLNLPAQSNLLVNMSTEQAVAESAPVVVRAAKLLGTPPAALLAAVPKKLSVQVPVLSDLLQITWQSTTPATAQAGANAFARAYLAYRQGQLAGEIATLRSSLSDEAKTLQQSIGQVSTKLSGTSALSARHRSLDIRLGQLTTQLKTISAQLATLSGYNASGGSLIAAPPGTRSGLGRKLLVLVAIFIGLMAGLVFAFVRDVFDDKVRDAAQLEAKLGVDTLAVLPSISNQTAAVASPGGTADSVRALRTTLVAAAGRSNVHTILLVSADGSLSSSQIAAGLGVTLAQSGRRVLLVAADLHGTQLPEIFELANWVGVSDLLTGGGDAQSLIRRPTQAGGVELPDNIRKRLGVLTAGAPTPEALAALDSGVMHTLLRNQCESYEFVILDSPPAWRAADVAALALQADGVIVVARKGRTTGRLLTSLRHQLDQVGATIIGGVLIVNGKPNQHSARPVARRSPDAEQPEQPEQPGQPVGPDRQRPGKPAGPDGQSRRAEGEQSESRQPLPSEANDSRGAVRGP